MVTTTDGQKDLFLRAKTLSIRVAALGGHVQNEIRPENMPDIGDFSDHISDIEKEFTEVSQQLNELKRDYTNFMRSLALKGFVYDK